MSSRRSTNEQRAHDIATAAAEKAAREAGNYACVWYWTYESVYNEVIKEM